MRKLVVILMVATALGVYQNLLACQAAFFRANVRCPCGGYFAVHKCQYMNYSSTCKYCNGWGTAGPKPGKKPKQRQCKPGGAPARNRAVRAATA